MSTESTPVEARVIITLSELHDNTVAVFEELQKTRAPVLVTDQGRYVGQILPVNDTGVMGPALAALAARAEFNRIWGGA